MVCIYLSWSDFYIFHTFHGAQHFPEPLLALRYGKLFCPAAFHGLIALFDLARLAKRIEVVPVAAHCCIHFLLGRYVRNFCCDADRFLVHLDLARLDQE